MQNKKNKSVILPVEIVEDSPDAEIQIVFR